MKKIVLVLALVLLATPASAERVIYNGSDLWTTPGNGLTFTDFSLEPIPAGFFCSKSAPFTGRVAFKGVPVATAKSGALGNTDTIIQRLDDAAFNKKGVAVTRLQVRALSLESIAPIKTACGLYKAVATLDGGPQPVTRMRIVRTHEKGGHFLAPLALNVRIIFIPVGGNVSTEKLELRQTVRFNAQPKPWESTPGGMQEKAGMYLVDTDGDRVPDSYVPGTSNFVLRGVDRAKITYTPRLTTTSPTIDPDTGYNHTAPTHTHYVTTSDPTLTTQTQN